jgi:DnaJ-class molecular chaperone
MVLNKGEVICHKCNGSGVLDDHVFKNDKKYNLVCYKCQGDGFLSWIENITGKKVGKTGYKLTRESRVYKTLSNTGGEVCQRPIAKVIHYVQNAKDIVSKE